MILSYWSLPFPFLFISEWGYIRSDGLQRELV
jgi:hypothetical protein